ncbi:haloacid dehalogenase type II [Brevibacillus sp. NRS-1366]|uniref:haloacid dehalogenase type II n=1 Tax=Brevibacillus sp. NRS-1366 TaxID=3233899 RepID=UPI003D254747
MSQFVRPSVLTFDCYGTLVDWETGQRRVFMEILSKKQANVTLEEFTRTFSTCQFHLTKGAYQPYRNILKSSLAQTLAHFDIAYDPADGEALVASMPEWEPFPEVPAALERLKERYKLCIISNTDNEIMAETLKRIGVRFDEVVTAMDSKAYKPDFRPFQLAQHRVEADGSKIMHICCDLEYDVAVAKQLGWQTVLVDRGQALSGSARPDYSFGNFHEVLKLLDY